MLVPVGQLRNSGVAISLGRLVSVPDHGGRYIEATHLVAGKPR